MKVEDSGNFLSTTIESDLLQKQCVVVVGELILCNL